MSVTLVVNESSRFYMFVIANKFLETVLWSFQSIFYLSIELNFFEIVMVLVIWQEFE